MRRKRDGRPIKYTFGQALELLGMMIQGKSLPRIWTRSQQMAGIRPRCKSHNPGTPAPWRARVKRYDRRSKLRTEERWDIEQWEKSGLTSVQSINAFDDEVYDDVFWSKEEQEAYDRTVMQMLREEEEDVFYEAHDTEDLIDLLDRSYPGWADADKEWDNEYMYEEL